MVDHYGYCVTTSSFAVVAVAFILLLLPQERPRLLSMLLFVFRYLLPPLFDMLVSLLLQRQEKVLFVFPLVVSQRGHITKYFPLFLYSQYFYFPYI